MPTTVPIPPSIHCPNATLGAEVQGIVAVAVGDPASPYKADRERDLVVTFNLPLHPGFPDLLFPTSYSLTGGQTIFPRILLANAYSTDPRQVILTLDTVG